MFAAPPPAAAVGLGLRQVGNYVGANRQGSYGHLCLLFLLPASAHAAAFPAAAALVVDLGSARWEIILGPIVKAAKATFKDPKREIWISLQGEMGATLAFFPDQWLALAQKLRKEYGSGGSKLMVGVTWVS
jgi:hypothetical protein